MLYIWLVLAIICLGYYLVCASYAGVGSSFIFIWIVGSLICACLFTLKLLHVKNIVVLPLWLRGAIFGFVCICLAVFIFVESLIIVDMHKGKKKPENLEYILVLGCQIRGSRITKSLRYRLDKCVEVANLDSNKAAKIIVSGGQGNGEDMPECLAMKNYLVEHGIGESRIIMEDKSTDTAENFRYSCEFIENKATRVGVVTSDFHLFRSISIGKKCGLTNVCGVASRTDSYLFINYMVREAIGVCKDWAIRNI